MRILDHRWRHQIERPVVGGTHVHHDFVAQRQDRPDALDDREVEPHGVANDGEAGDAH
jgi:hypothetical protein